MKNIPDLVTPCLGMWGYALYVLTLCTLRVAHFEVQRAAIKYGQEANLNFKANDQARHGVVLSSHGLHWTMSSSPYSHSLPPVYSISYLNKDKKLQF